MKLLSRKILLIPFYLLTLAADMAGMVSRRFLIRNQSPKPKLSVTGISVVIPERNNQEMLRRCLHSVLAACACVTEPTQIIVVVSEARPDMYGSSNLNRCGLSKLFLSALGPLSTGGFIC